MKTIYIAPGVGTGDGSGPSASQAAPDASRIPWEPGAAVLFLRGTSLYLPPRSGRAGIFIPNMDDITLSYYGDAEAPPVLHGARSFNSGWSDVGAGVFSIIGPEKSGVVLYRNQPLPFFDDEIPNAMDQLAASVDGGYIIGSGGTSPAIYVKLPGAANPNNGGVSISETMIGVECTHDNPVSGLVIDGLELFGFSRQGINLRNVRNAQVRHNIVHATGGDRTNSWYVGGCIQCTAGCDTVEIAYNHVYDCFDSPFSPQVPAGFNNALIQNIHYHHNLVDGGWALAGVEIANWAQNGTIRNIRITNNRIVNGGSGFSGMGDGPRGPLGVIINSNQSPSVGNRFEGIEVTDNHIENCPSGGVYVEHANSSDILIARNSIHSCGHAGGRGRAGTGNVQQRGGIEVRTNQPLDQVVNIISNEISNCGKHGISFSSKNATTAGSIVNNTLVSNGTDNVILNSDSALPSVRNNICSGAGIRKQGVAQLQENSNNVYMAQSSFAGFSPSQSSTQVDPGFVDPSAGDYQLLAGSAMIGAGNSVAAFDRIGRAYVTQDLGCYASRSGSDCVDLEKLTEP